MFSKTCQALGRWWPLVWQSCLVPQAALPLLAGDALDLSEGTSDPNDEARGADEEDE